MINNPFSLCHECTNKKYYPNCRPSVVETDREIGEIDIITCKNFGVTLKPEPEDFMEFTLEEIKEAFFSSGFPDNYENYQWDKLKERLKLKFQVKELWKTDFEEYLKLINEAKIKIITTPALAHTYNDIWPNLNIQKSIELSIKTFWGTEKGWKYKIKDAKKVKKVDFVRTLLNSVKMNRVFNTWEDRNQQPQHPVKNVHHVTPEVEI